jgi:chromosome segregation ATPase
MKLVVLLVAMVTLIGSPALAQGRARGRQYNKRDVERIIKRLEKNTDTFKKAVDRQLDRSILDGTKREDRINDRVSDLEKATDRLRNRFDRSDNWIETRSDVEEVVREARNIHGLFDRVRAYSRVRSSWAAVRADINTLAAVYDIRPLR